MLKIHVIAIGKDKDAWVSEGCRHYLKLLGRSASVSMDILPAVKGSDSLSPAEVMQQEAKRFRRRLAAKSGEYVVALGERGESMDSQGFARRLQRWQSHSGGQVAMLIGGAYGLDPGLLAEASEVLSLSPLTFSHQLVRLILLEQLYRGFSILQGGPYHK